MKYKLRTHSPHEPIEFWCNCCDSKKVNSQDHETGRFYIQWGHVFKYAGIKDDYEAIVFALCHECATDFPVEE